jgi:FkbM family methyltransferase
MSDINEHELAELLKPYKRHPNLVILEVGANDGMETKMLMRCARRAHVHSFECDPRAIARWRSIVKTNRATLYEVAVCDQIGETTFYPSGGNPGGRWENYGSWDKSGSILPFDRHCDNAPWMEFPESFTVKTTTLDTWAESHLFGNWICAMLWVDVQGAEALMLKGATNVLQRVKFAFMECDPRPNYKGQAKRDDLVKLLPDFRVVKEYPGFNLLFVNDSLK